MEKEILNYCNQKNVLLDGSLINLFKDSKSFDDFKNFLDKVKLVLNKKFITKRDIDEKVDILKIISSANFEDNTFINLLKNSFSTNEWVGDKIENRETKKEISEISGKVKIKSSYLKDGKAFSVKDFVEYFRARYSSMSNILQERSELENLTSISKISNEKQKVSVIGMVLSKKQTKNKNIILEIEDLTGRMKVLISSNNEDLIKESEDITLDSVIGFKGFGSGEILFVNEIVFPETRLLERKKSPEEEYVLFLGDMHFGSKKFLAKSFQGFLDYLNGKVKNTPEVEKIKYIFIVGDLVTGIGNYPNQEEDLVIGDLEEQFIELANLLKQIPKRIKIIISAGNHDCVRLMEPQPILDEKYAWALYDMENVIVTENPASVIIGEKSNFPGWEILTYHGFSYPFYANTIPKLMVEKTMNAPEKIMKYLLKNRHLAPTHGSTQYFPSKKDHFFIKRAPDIFVSGHTHKAGLAYENNVLVISVSTWEGMTSYQEKFGNKPDHCKVPMVNMKTRAVKILDFEVDEGIKVYREEEE